MAADEFKKDLLDLYKLYKMVELQYEMFLCKECFILLFLWLKRRDTVHDKSSWVKMLCVYLEAFSQKEGIVHYDVIDFELPMTLGLYNYYGENDMVTIGSIDFVGREEMYEALKETLEDE